MIQTTSFGDPSNPTHQVLSYERQGEQIVERASVVVVVNTPLSPVEVGVMLDRVREALTGRSPRFGEGRDCG